MTYAFGSAEKLLHADAPTGPAAPSLARRASRPLVLINHLVEPPGKITGITRYAFGLVDALLDRDRFRYALASPWRSGDLPSSIADRLDLVLTYPYVEQTPLNYIQQRRMLREAAAATGASYIHAINPMCPSVPGVPTVVTAHDLYMKTLPHMYAARHRLWWNIFFNLAAHGASAVACVSRNTENDVKRFHRHAAHKTRLVPGAPVMPRQAVTAPLPANVSGPYVLFLGNLSPNKNAPFLIEALRRLARAGTPVTAYHVGRDPEGVLKSARDVITPLGGVDDATLDSILTHAAALVSCSSYEGFGLPLIEAHDRGTPVIATDIPVFREVAPVGSMLFGLDDIDGFAGAMLRVINEPGLRASLGAAGRANAARYSWHRTAEAVEGLVREFAPAAAAGQS